MDKPTLHRRKSPTITENIVSGCIFTANCYKCEAHRPCGKMCHSQDHTISQLAPATICYPPWAFSHYTTPAWYSWITHTWPHRGLGLSNGGGECTWRREERGRLIFLCWVWQLGGWLGAERKLTPSQHSERLRPTWRPLRVLEPWARPYTSIRHPPSVSFTHQHNTCIAHALKGSTPLTGQSTNLHS